MKRDLTELVFILDRSGSMGGLESDTIGGFNSMLKKQRDEQGECRITTVLFDNEYEVLHDRIDLKAVSPITQREYYVRGQTALLDAIGRTINKIGGVQKNTVKDYRACKVLFIITTDGMENASREFTYEKVKVMIERQKSEYNWEFLFLGANIDAVETAVRFGIAPNRSQSYHSDSEGTNLNYRVITNAIAAFREQGAIPSIWSKEIEEDYKRRGGR